MSDGSVNFSPQSCKSKCSIDCFIFTTEISNHSTGLVPTFFIEPSHQRNNSLLWIGVNGAYILQCFQMVVVYVNLLCFEIHQEFKLYHRRKGRSDSVLLIIFSRRQETQVFLWVWNVWRRKDEARLYTPSAQFIDHRIIKWCAAVSPGHFMRFIYKEVIQYKIASIVEQI